MNAQEKFVDEIPLDFCSGCREMKPAYGFFNLACETGRPVRCLCSRCYNDEYTRHADLPRLERVDFEPIVRHDAIGKAHTFHFVVQLSTGLGIRAFELVDGSPGGYQFMVLEPPESSVQQAYTELVRKIEAGIVVRYLHSSDFPGAASQNRLYIKGKAVNGRIEESEAGPLVVVDGQEMTWEEFGRCVSSAMGFNFRLEVFDPCESPDTTADPARPNPTWWLPDLNPDESDDGRHH